MNEGLEPQGRKGALLHGNAGKEAGYRKVSRALRAIYLFQFMNVEGVALVLGISRQNAFNLVKKMTSKGLIKGYSLKDYFCYFLTKDGEAVALLEFQHEHRLYKPSQYHGNPSTVRDQSIKERLTLPYLIAPVREYMEWEYPNSCGEFESIEVLETTFSLRMKDAECQPDMILSVNFDNGVVRHVAVELETTNKTPRELDQKFWRLNKWATKGKMERFNHGIAGFQHVLAFTHLDGKAEEMRDLLDNGVVVWEKRADNQWHVVTERGPVRIPAKDVRTGESRKVCESGGADERGNPLFYWVIRDLPKKRQLEERVFLGVRMFEYAQYGALPKVP